MKAGAGTRRLHGGGTPYDHARCYPWGNERMYNGLVVAQFALSDAGGDHGGFCAIPGSHKANLRTPAEVRDLEHLELTREAGLVCPPVKTGDLILFTEALTHGTLPWTPGFERRALLYKFSPGHQSWSKRHRPAPEGAELTEEQARLFRPPAPGPPAAALAAAAAARADERGEAGGGRGEVDRQDGRPFAQPAAHEPMREVTSIAAERALVEANALYDDADDVV